MEHGASLAGITPPGYHHIEFHADLGRGPAVFAVARTALQSWQAHRLPGMQVHPHDAPIQPGSTVVLSVGTRLGAQVVPCRIMSGVDEPGRWGFAYGTLPGHPETGEEAFVVSLEDSGAVRFTISAFSRPGDRATRLLGPVGRALQVIGNRGYLRALQRSVRAAAADEGRDDE